MSTTNRTCIRCNGTGRHKGDDLIDDNDTCYVCHGAGSYEVTNVPNGTRATIPGLNQ